MGRLSQDSSAEVVLGRGVTVQWRVINNLLKQEEPIQQAELARKIGTSEVTVNRIMTSLVEDKKWKKIFRTDKRYGGRIYWIEKNEPLAQKLFRLRDVLSDL